MRTCLAAMAVAAALPCAAQTSEDPVTLYGRVYVMFDSVEAKGGAAPLPRRNRVTDQASHLGIRGTEGLGSSGWKAFYQMETAFSPDAASGTFARRNSGVGLQHKRWGTVVMGRWDMPMKRAQVAPLDPFTDLALADMTGTAFNQGNFANREENVIQYWLDMGELDVRVAYAANESKTAARDPYKYGASVVWSNKTVYLTYAYEKHKNYRDGTITTGVDEDGHGVGGYVRLGGAKVMAHYGQYSRTGTRKQKSYAVGVDWIFSGAHHLLASYQNSRNGGATNAAQPRCDAVGIGYRYDFSRRTFFTAYYTKVDNEVGNLCNFGAAALTIAEGQDPQGWSAGIRHTF